MIRKPEILFCLLLLTVPAAAQTPAPSPPPAGASPTDDWPWPAPDPKTWWEDEWPKPPEAADPLAGRRLSRGERLVAIDNGYDPLLYRLWRLMPLQTQVLRGGEMILEVAVRPASSTRQSLIRVTVRRDGKVFVQGRAGLGCCEPEIGRRVGFDVEAPEGLRARLLALREHPVWNAPRDVRVVESAGSADALCVEGASYDLTLMVPGRSRSVRRACDNAEVGEAAEVLEAAFAAALGHEPRFDVLYPGGADFSAQRRAYEELIAGGGQLKAAPNARAQPPAFEPVAGGPEEAPAAPTP
jgi:hypothetical protein